MHKLKLEIVKGKSDSIDATQLMSRVNWSGDYKQVARILEFELVSSPYDKNIPRIDVELGDGVRFSVDDTVVFEGSIENISKSYTSESINYKCFDHSIFLLRNEGVYNVKKTTPESLANKIFADFQIPSGDIISTDIEFDKKFFGVKLYDIIMTGYTIASSKNNKKYMVELNKGKIDIVEKGKIKLEIEYANGCNLMDSEFSEDLGDMCNKVVVINDDGTKKTEVKNDKDLEKFGSFQKVLKSEEGTDDATQAKAMLKGINQNARIKGIGDISCRTGYAVTVEDAYTGLKGLFYIDKDTHTWENGVYDVSLDLNFQNIMNEISAGEDEKEENKNTDSSTDDSSTGGSSDDNSEGQEQDVTGGKEVNAEFTAYYPANNSMQGGFLDAMGNKLDPKKLTCAAPKDIAFKTKIQVKDTGTSRDNVVYTVTDRGGAIKVVNGVYKIDLLMATKQEALAFGRRKGKAIIGVNVSSNSSNSNSSSNSSGSNDKASKIVAAAKSKLGCKYVWGATGPNTFDCSGLTSWCHKQAGISIPRTSGAQRGSGKKISKSDAKPGDIVCFDGHVGLYVGNGQMIHAPNSKKPVKYDPCLSGYWGGKLLGIRRYW